MRIPTGVLGRLLTCLLPLAMVWPLAGQQTDSPANKGENSLKKPAEFKGQAKISLHSYKMEKGSTYRITVKGDGFVPRVRIDGQSNGPFGNPTGSGLVNFSLQNPKLGRGPSNVAQLIFTPRDARVYQIKVDFALGSEINKGPNPYTLTIERAVFQPHVAMRDSQIDLSQHSKKLEHGKVYSIMVTGRGFAPEVQILDGKRSVATALYGRWFGFGPDAEHVTTLTFAPAKSTAYRILVAVGPVSEQRTGPLAYTTQVVELQVKLSVNVQLTKQDPLYPRRGGPHKVHTVKLEAGKNYQIEMTTRAFDAYLFLEDSAGNLLLEDDDGAGALNARLIFRPAKTDTYRIVATTFNRGAPSNATGPYTLTVVENPHTQPRFPASPFGKGFPEFQK